MIFSNSVYNTLKWVATIFLPAVSALYFGLSELWNLPRPLEVVGSLTVINTFIGALIGISTQQYNAKTPPPKHVGTMNMIDSPEKTTFNLELDEDPGEIKPNQDIIFKVKKS